MLKRKYNNKITYNNGLKFDSILESRIYTDLVLLQKAKRITNLLRQVKIPLSFDNKVKYIADFIYYDFDKKAWIIADAKGFETKEYKIKRAWLLNKYYNYIFIEIKKDFKKEYYPLKESKENFIEFIAKLS